MASSKKGLHAGTGHLFGSYWKHLRKEGKQQFWKKERQLTGLAINENGNNERGGTPGNPVYKGDLSKNAQKRKKKHKQLLKEIYRRAARTKNQG
jgi:hypothetical protein